MGTFILQSETNLNGQVKGAVLLLEKEIFHLETEIISPYSFKRRLLSCILFISRNKSQMTLRSERTDFA